MKNKHLPVAAILAATALACTAVGAAEWTRTIDLTKAETTSSYLLSAMGTSNEAFWIGPEIAIDPATGATLSPYAIPERLAAVRSGGTVDMISSQRGKLWSSTHGQSGWHVEFEPDLEGNLWGSSNAIAADRRVTGLTPDGAQPLLLTAADLGHPTLCVLTTRPLQDSAGAMVLLAKCDGSGAEAHILRLDSRGRIRTSVAASGCALRAYDDRDGGYFATCAASATTPSTLTRVARNPDASWPRLLETNGLSSVEVFRDSSLLISAYRGADVGYQWRYLNADGSERFATFADHAASAGDSFWFWSRAGSELLRMSRDGTVLARANATDVVDLVAHPGGAVMARTSRANGNDRSEHYRLFSASALPIRVIPAIQEIVQPVSRIRFNFGRPYVEAADGRTSANFIDESGGALQPEFSTRAGGWDSSIARALADARTVCVDSFFISIVTIPAVYCTDRNTNVETTLAMGNVKLLHVGDVIVIRDSDMLRLYTRSGRLIRDIDLTGAQDFAIDKDRGIAVLQSFSGENHLRRYRLDGTFITDTLVQRPIVGGRVAVGDAGSSLVVTALPLVTVIQYNAAGQVLAARDIAAEVGNLTIVDASLASTGAQILLQSGRTHRSYGGRVIVLNNDLRTLATHILPRAELQMTTHGDEADFDVHALWPSDHGHARVASFSAAGLVVQQFDAVTGEVSERRMLPMNQAAELSRSGERRFAVDTDGTVRGFDFDPRLKRDVLRISEAPAARFNGPIKQRALAGSWFSPNSTGQGLLLELLNRDEVLFAAWHTYAPEGGNALAKQQWFTINGEIGTARGKVTLPIYRNANGRFDLEGSTAAQSVGSAELVFSDCDHMEFWYRIGDEAGAFPMQRLTPRTLACDDGTQIVQGTDLPAGIDLSGAWYDPARSGQGFTFNATGARFKTFLAGWFTYDAEGAVDDPDAQHWFTLQGATPDRFGQPIAAKIHRTIGGSRAGAPTQNSHQVGNAMLTVHDCATATLEYVFDDSALAGAFANRSRSIALKRLGSCPN